MKRKILSLCTVLILSGIALSYGQKCKYEYQKTDELTGKTSKAVLFEVAKELDLQFKNVGDNTYLMDVIIHPRLFEAIGSGMPAMVEGDVISFKLNTGKIVEIYVTQTMIVAILPANQLNTCLFTDIHVDKETLELLSNSMVSYIRTNVGKKLYEGYLKEKDAKKLQEKFKCILQ